MTADDARLTAYVLGELDEEGARAYRELVESNQDLAANLAAIQDAAAQVELALAAEAAAVPPDPRLLDVAAAGARATRPAGESRRGRAARAARSWWAGAGTPARALVATGALAVGLLMVHDAVAVGRWGPYWVRETQIWMDSVMKDAEGISGPPAPIPAPAPPLVVSALRRLAGPNHETGLSGPGTFALGDASLHAPDPIPDLTAMWSTIAQATAPPVGSTGGGPAPVLDPMSRIMKNGTITLETTSVPAAIGRIAAIAASLGGYVAQTRTEQSPDATDTAEIVIGVPAGDFETALVRTREVGTVQAEQVASADVSQEYVDLESEISNLEATRARIREFLAKASNVEEALRVNDELTRIESEIAQRKGRLQWLAQRSAFSLLTITVLEKKATATATPTPTARPPVQGLGLAPWSPAGPAQGAVRLVVVAYRGLANALITGGVFLLALSPVLAAAWWLRRRSIGSSAA